MDYLHKYLIMLIMLAIICCMWFITKNKVAKSMLTIVITIEVLIFVMIVVLNAIS